MEIINIESEKDENRKGRQCAEARDRVMKIVVEDYDAAWIVVVGPSFSIFSLTQCGAYPLRH